MIFSKIIFVDFFFNIELVKNYNYNKTKSYGKNIVIFPRFVYDFFQNYLCRFFFNIELIKNYNYNNTKSYGESVVVFLTKHCRLL
jgi:hypothetical protein